VASIRRDYYEVLGVARQANDATIKKAFRRLARELHPDVSNEPDAEERFREAAEAYEVLSNAETRELYDRFGHDGLRSGGFRPTTFDVGGFADLFSAFFGDDLFGASSGRRRARGGDAVAEIEIELEEAATGVTREVPFRVAVGCPTCSGSGAAPGSVPETCPRCAGAGRLQEVSQTLLGQFVRAQLCPTCNGGGKIVTDLCTTCDGEGRLAEARTIEVPVPAGIHDGQRIRLTGRGHAGPPGGSNGDAYVIVHVRPDPRFVRDGDDVASRIDLTMTQAALGARLTVDTLGGPVELEFPPGTQPGEVRVLRGRGMPSNRRRTRGDHRILVNVLIPRHLSDEQRSALEAFQQGANAGTYEPDEGFFERIRAVFR
jgi:molecular chaperone DnaJ